MVRNATPSAPERGDLVWLDFSPQAGHEQAGKRPALVLSPRDYNVKAGLALMCPITSQVKGYPFEVPLPGNLKLHGVVLSDQVRSIDWRSRGCRPAEHAPDHVVAEVAAKLAALLAEQP